MKYLKKFNEEYSFKYCHECGTKLSEKDAYCDNCGEKQEFS